MVKRVFEQITNYLYYNNDPEWKRRKIETVKSKIDTCIKIKNKENIQNNKIKK